MGAACPEPTFVPKVNLQPHITFPVQFFLLSTLFSGINEWISFRLLPSQQQGAKAALGRRQWRIVRFRRRWRRRRWRRAKWRRRRSHQEGGEVGGSPGRAGWSLRGEKKLAQARCNLNLYSPVLLQEGPQDSRPCQHRPRRLFNCWSCRHRM